MDPLPGQVCRPIPRLPAVLERAFRHVNLKSSRLETEVEKRSLDKDLYVRPTDPLQRGERHELDSHVRAHTLLTCMYNCRLF